FERPAIGGPAARDEPQVATALLRALVLGLLLRDPGEVLACLDLRESGVDPRAGGLFLLRRRAGWYERRDGTHLHRWRLGPARLLVALVGLLDLLRVRLVVLLDLDVAHLRLVAKHERGEFHVADRRRLVLRDVVSAHFVVGGLRAAQHRLQRLPGEKVPPPRSLEGGHRRSTSVLHVLPIVLFVELPVALEVRS